MSTNNQLKSNLITKINTIIADKVLSGEYFRNTEREIRQHYDNIRTKSRSEIHIHKENPKQLKKAISSLDAETRTTEKTYDKKLKKQETNFTLKYLGVSTVAIAASIYLASQIVKTSFSPEEWNNYSKLKISTIDISNSQKHMRKIDKTYTLSIEELDNLGSRREELSDLAQSHRENNQRIEEYLKKANADLTKIENAHNYKSHKRNANIAACTGLALAFFSYFIGYKKTIKTMRLRDTNKSLAENTSCNIFNQYRKM